jgi:hypothetical protein
MGGRPAAFLLRPRVSEGNRLFSSESKIVLNGHEMHQRYLDPARAGVLPRLNIWYEERQGDQWGPPQDPGAPFNPMKTMYVSMTRQGTIYAMDIISSFTPSSPVLGISEVEILF